jgi:hypothetical protein
MYEQRNALNVEKDALLSADTITPDQEARGLEIANKLDELNGQIKAAQLRERFATQASVQSMDKASEERSMEQRATNKYRDQFIAYMRGQGPAPEVRETNTGTGSGVLIPKIYEDGILKYLLANTVVRNIADIRTGVQGYPTVRWNQLLPGTYSNSWTNPDTGTGSNVTAAANYDPGIQEQAIAPYPCLPYTTVSRQSLIQSNFDLEAEVVDTLQRQLANNLEFGYVGGAGSSSNQPNGLFTTQTYNGTTNPVNIVSVTGTTGTSGSTTRAQAITDSISVDNLLSMRYSKLPAAYWNSAQWVMSQDVYAAIAGLKASTTSNVPLFVPSSDYQTLQNAAPMTLLGLPVYVTMYSPTYGATAATKNTLLALGSIQDCFSIREWGGMTMIRDEISAAGSARIKFYAMAFANSVFTRTNALVQLQCAAK